MPGVDSGMKCGIYMCGKPASFAFVDAGSWSLQCEDCAYDGFVHTNAGQRSLHGFAQRLTLPEFSVWLIHNE